MKHIEAKVKKLTKLVSEFHKEAKITGRVARRELGKALKVTSDTPLTIQEYDVLGARVHIIKKDGLVYQIYPPLLRSGLEVILKKIKIDFFEDVEEKSLESLVRDVYTQVEKQVDLDRLEIEKLVYTIVDQRFPIGRLILLFLDKKIKKIMCDREVKVLHEDYGWMQTKIFIEKSKLIQELHINAKIDEEDHEIGSIFGKYFVLFPQKGKFVISNEKEHPF